jgi:hypothetical protein
MVLMRRFVRVRCSTVELFPKTILLQAVVEKNLDGSEAPQPLASKGDLDLSDFGRLSKR